MSGNTAISLVHKFWRLATAGKSAAIDFNTQTGDITLRCSYDVNTCIEGACDVPAKIDDAWHRVMLCINGEVILPENYTTKS